MESDAKQKRKPNPRENANLLSVLTFSYLLPTFIDGFKRDLEEEDLPETLTENKAAILGDKMEKAWNEEVLRASELKLKPSLRRVLWKIFGLKLISYGMVVVVCETLWVLQPTFLNWLLAYYKPNQTEITKPNAYLYAAGLVMCSLLNALMFHSYMMASSHLGMKIRVACCSLIYRKALNLTQAALRQTAVGQIVNLLSNDVMRFERSFLYIHYIWIAPIETVVCAYLMYLHMGVSAIIGVVVMVSFVPLQGVISRRLAVFRLKTAQKTDSRIKLISEILSGIQVIKMYAWEKPFAALIENSRRQEVKNIRVSTFLLSMSLSFFMFITPLSVFSSVVPFVLFGNIITAEKIFVMLSYYGILKMSMPVLFFNGLPLVTQMNVSINRLNKFLLFEDMGPKQIKKKSTVSKYISHKDNDVFTSQASIKRKRSRIDIIGVNAKWSKSSPQNTLSNINLSINPGELFAIIGPVGGGKTSLLHAILKELPLTTGKIIVEDNISYASQDPWLFAGTIRQNILFGLPMNIVRYKAVVRKCALKRDFEILPNKDLTIVGDRGVSLSGGQRARINLARAVYRDADVYLLDDPLSAVDTHVGKQLFDDCIKTFLKDSTVILVTHQMQYLKEADHIAYVDEGKLQAYGTYSEIIQTGLEFTKLLEVDSSKDQDIPLEEDYEATARKSSVYSVISSLGVEEAKNVQESKSTGAVTFQVYKSYFKAGGNCFKIFLMFFFFIAAQGFSTGADYFLSYWINHLQVVHLPKQNSRYRRDAYNNSHAILSSQVNDSTIHNTMSNPYSANTYNQNTYIYIYTGICAMLITMTLLRLIAYVSMCMKASETLHNRMFFSIVKATMAFFNNNPAGRILNRFTKDMGTIDDLLPSTLLDSIQIILAFISITIVVSVINYYLLIPSAVLFLILYLLRAFYLGVSRALKRLEGTTRSPVYSHIAASLHGLTTIRAFNAKEMIIAEFDNHQDLHSSAWHFSAASSFTFGYWLDLVCVVYIALVAFSFLIFGTEKLGGNVGLAITQVTSVSRIFQWGMKQSAILENEMTAVERVMEYEDIEHERAIEAEDTLSSAWPQHGKITFKDLCLQYSPLEPPVLQNLNFVIQPKEKIGIVGRTGAGKSSLIQAIFQTAYTSGSIFIDEVDITQINLDCLRSKISIIPQEPVIFSGTVRYNLDPFDKYPDEELWHALSDVELKQAVSQLKGGLHTELSEGGINFSVGQRQLICLARAILCKNKILILDEATANVDPQTDALIQNTIRKKFENCTVLTIAHRLHTIMDSDKVMVMDAGKLREFDHPYLLLQNKESLLFSLVQQTCESMADNLFKIAENSYLSKT